MNHWHFGIEDLSTGFFKLSGSGVHIIAPGGGGGLGGDERSRVSVIIMVCARVCS